MKERVLLRVLPAVAATAALLAGCGGGSGAGTIPMNNSPTASVPLPQTVSQAIGSSGAVTSSFAEVYPEVRTETRQVVLPPELTANTWQAGLSGPNVTQTSEGNVAHIMPWPVLGRATPAVVHFLLYHGGPIEKTPKQVLVFWGFGNCTLTVPPACPNDPNHTTEILTHFLQNSGGSQYLSVTTQYSSTAQGHITNPINTLIAILIDLNSAPLHPTQAQVAGQAAVAENFLISHHVVSGNNKDVNYVVALGHNHNPTGFRPGGFCAFHSAFGTTASFQPYTDFPYVTQAGTGCGAFTVSGANDGVSIVLGHEDGETITDPGLNAWFDVNGEEIGDKCANLGLNRFTTLRNGDVDPVQPLWSNAARGCVI